MDRFNRPAEERILRSVLRDYDTDARGNRKAEATVTVSVQFVLLRIQDLVRPFFQFLLMRIFWYYSGIMFLASIRYIYPWNNFQTFLLFSLQAENAVRL